MAATRFRVEIQMRGSEKLDELRQRAGNLTEVLQNIVKEWAKGNIDKFAMSEGKETSGLSLDPTVLWPPLTEAYRKQKQNVYPDWLMVRTGSLREALTNPDMFFNYVSPTQAIFGTPQDPEDVKKITSKRPVVFIGRTDMNMIRQHLQNYFAFGANYESLRFASGSAGARKTQAAQMDAEWGDSVKGIDDGSN